MDTNASSPTASLNASTKLSSPRLYSTKTNSIVPTVFAVALAVSSLGLAGSAFAEAPDSNLRTMSAEVTFTDLNLSAEDGARTLLKRLDRAAMVACGGKPVYSPLLPREPTRFRNCVRNAVDTAVRGVDAPVLTAMHNETAITAVTRLASR